MFGVGSVVRARAGVRDEEDEEEDLGVGERVNLWSKMFAICDGIVKVE